MRQNTLERHLDSTTDDFQSWSAPMRLGYAS
jgi:hypothetical protein